MNYLGIDKTQSKNTVKELNQLLACYHVYYQNLRNFHWNVTGENFFDLHGRFEEFYMEARSRIDAIAERILTLRHRPMSTLSTYLDKSLIAEAGLVADDREMVHTILDNHRVLIDCMRNTLRAASKVEDEGTIDLIGGFLADLEKSSWMLDAWYTRTTEMTSA